MDYNPAVIIITCETMADVCYEYEYKTAQICLPFIFCEFSWRIVLPRLCTEIIICCVCLVRKVQTVFMQKAKSKTSAVKIAEFIHSLCIINPTLYSTNGLIF